MESNVHFPTDISLLYDSVKSSVRTVEKLLVETDLKGWRKSKYWKKEAKGLSRNLNKIIRGGGKRKHQRVKRATNQYLRVSKTLSNKIKLIKNEIKSSELTPLVLSLLEDLNYYESMLNKHIDLVERRLVKGEIIPHDEKLFSIYEPYTEWVNKGKSGNRIELGLKIAICSDQFGFILHHRVMQNEQDVDVAIPMIEHIENRYELESASFDKGFWSKKNFEKLYKIVPILVLPKKGKRNLIENKREGEKKFKQLRKQHSAVESNINMLEQHGLNRCPDRGLKHFKNYTALGIVSYNLHRLGNLLKKEKIKELEKLKKKAV